MRQFTEEELQNEQWKEIEGCEKKWISSIGRIKTYKKGREHIIEPQKNNYGELFVVLKKGNKMCGMIVRKETAKAFVPNPNHYKYIRQIDGDKLNCRAENLEWCRVTDRMQEQFQSRVKEINQYSPNGKYLMTWESADEIAEYFHIPKSRVYSACRKTSGAVCGSLFRYEEDFPAGQNIDVHIREKNAGVRQYTTDGNLLGEYSSVTEATKALGGKATSANIVSCCRGIRHTAYRYVWEYTTNRQ